MTRFGLLLSAASALIGVMATPASARTAFDGAWSVLIVTDKGACEPAYRTSVNIVNGSVTGGSSVASVSGRVAPSGSISVRVTSGTAQGSGSGRLGRSAGGGSWRGYGSTGQCAGRWSAQRY